MGEPMRIRAQAKDGNVVVRVLMSHEMETGLRKDSAGKPIPAWYITEMSAALNGRTVLSGQWGTAIAKNPYLQFTVRGGKVGDKVTLHWVDNRGDQRTDEALVA